MAIKLKIRKGATVEVITGADKGKRGTVLEVDKDNLRIRVQGVKVQTRHSKKDGLLKSEGFIDYSNVKLVEAAPEAKKAAKKASKAKTA
jgi:large subunit ribosomal protein L24